MAGAGVRFSSSQPKDLCPHGCYALRGYMTYIRPGIVVRGQAMASWQKRWVVHCLVMLSGP